MFLDSNIVIEMLNHDTTNALPESILADAAASGELLCNLIVVAEVAAGLEQSAALFSTLADLSIAVADLDLATALRAAQAHRLYRRRGGPRESILPDFLVAAHAATLGARLMTHDRRLSSYFPELTLLVPETHPNG